MTEHFKKYKWTILFWAILLFIMLNFAPRQSNYYLEQDIKQFKTLYLIPILFWTFGLILIGLLVFWLTKTKSVKQLSLAFLLTSLKLAVIIFIFQDVFLGIALFANRQITKGKVAKTYQVSFMTETDQSKSNFYLYEPTTGQTINDRKLLNKTYTPDLKQNDKISFPMRIGLFGIPFTSYPLDNKF